MAVSGIDNTQISEFGEADDRSPLQLVHGDQFPSGKRALKILRRNGFGPIGNIEGRSIHEWINPGFFGKSCIAFYRRIGFHKFVIPRPERELVLDVLGFRDIDRRVAWSFAAFVLQIKGEQRGRLIFVADQEYFGSKLVFEVDPKFVDGFRDRLPSLQF